MHRQRHSVVTLISLFAVLGACVKKKNDAQTNAICLDDNSSSEVCPPQASGSFLVGDDWGQKAGKIYNNDFLVSVPVTEDDTLLWPNAADFAVDKVPASELAPPLAQLRQTPQARVQGLVTALKAGLSLNGKRIIERAQADIARVKDFFGRAPGARAGAHGAGPTQPTGPRIVGHCWYAGPGLIDDNGIIHLDWSQAAFLTPQPVSDAALEAGVDEYLQSALASNDAAVKGIKGYKKLHPSDQAFVRGQIQMLLSQNQLRKPHELNLFSHLSAERAMQWAERYKPGSVKAARAQQQIVHALLSHRLVADELIADLNVVRHFQGKKPIPLSEFIMKLKLSPVVVTTKWDAMDAEKIAKIKNDNQAHGALIAKLEQASRGIELAGTLATSERGGINERNGLSYSGFKALAEAVYLLGLHSAGSSAAPAPGEQKASAQSFFQRVRGGVAREFAVPAARQGLCATKISFEAETGTTLLSSITDAAERW